MLTQAEYRRLKTRLTRRQNAFNKARAAVQSWTDPREPHASAREAMRTAAVELEREARYGINYFAEHGSPDDWARWDVASGDASYMLMRLS